MASGKTFADMKLNVGTMVGDTSDAFATKIGVWINNRYRDCFRRYQWPQLFGTQVITTVAGTSDYDLNADFAEAIYVYDDTNKVPLTAKPEMSEQQNELLTGAPNYYTIAEVNTSTSRRVLKLFYTPSSVISIVVRYKKDYSPLSADADAPIIDLCDEIELGAEANAWRAKRQFSKSQAVESQYESSIATRIFQEEQNKDISIDPIPYNRGN